MTLTSPLTANQRCVLDALQQADKPLSAYSLLERLSDQGLRAPTQVYRALQSLSQMGLVRRLETLNAYTATAGSNQEACGTLLLAICRDCGGVREFAMAELSQCLEGLAEQIGFTPAKTPLEVVGQCARCARLHCN